MNKMTKTRRINPILEGVLVDWERIAKQNTGLKWRNTDIQEIAGNVLKRMNFEISAKTIPKSREREIFTRFKFKKGKGLGEAL